MIIETSKQFLKLYQKLPSEVQTQAKKSLALLRDNPFHPSLEHKKMTGYKDVWELRVNINYRITYQKIGDTAFLRKIGTHDLLQNP
ncbi:MAG: type II toxin-antitoxin system mRNA interferase toxin, RelE/StbE family [Candidatus Omnitrophica bacterium]|nr:type II toxin-antitoxin system mRNA interferase toxin, RelE/StbE family [Candidatus Omnitrophota bacterium]